MSGGYYISSPIGGVGSGSANDIAIWTGPNAIGDSKWQVVNNSLASKNGALLTSATNGFLYVPSSAGTPTGVPTVISGQTAFEIDSTNSLLYYYSGGAWKTPSSNPTLSAKSANFTAADNFIYLCNTSGGAFTATLPNPTLIKGRITFVDSGGSFQNFNLTIARFSTEKIRLLASSFICSANGGAYSFVTNGTDWFEV